MPSPITQWFFSPIMMSTGFVLFPSKDTKIFVSNNMFGGTAFKMLGWAMFVPTC